MRHLLLNDKSRIFSMADPYEVSRYVNCHVGTHDLRLSRACGTGASLGHRKIGGIDLCHLTYGAQVRVVSEGLPDIYHVQFIVQGHCRYEVGHDILSVPAGHVLIINPENPIDLTYSKDCQKFIVKISSAMLHEACLEHRWFKANEKIIFNQVPYRFEELDSLIHLLTLLCHEAESGLATPQMLNHYNHVVTGKLMTMLEHNVCMVAPPQQSVSFDRLVQYIEDNIKQDITTEGLAQYAKMSPRSLYLLFKRNAKTTPKNFIRQRKLEHVYAALMDPTRNIVNVTAVALDYGFTHLGRFSDFYKSAFGMLPSESLRARQTRN